MPPRLRDSSTAQPDIAIERQQRYREMWRTIDEALEPIEARVMALHYGYELPLAAITQKLALTNPSGAKAYVVNARRKLSRIIERRGRTNVRSCARTEAQLERPAPPAVSSPRFSFVPPHPQTQSNQQWRS